MIAASLCLTVWTRHEPAVTNAPQGRALEVVDATVVQPEKICDLGADVGDAFKKCWTAHFESVAAKDGVVAALQNVQEVGKAHSNVNSLCHEFDHKLGRWAYKDTEDVLKALTYDDRACQYGFMHGVLEAFAMTATDAEMKAKLPVVCEPRRATVKTPGLERDLGECLHGLGHAAAVHTQDDVFRALEWCRLGTTTRNEIGSCAGGALMEYGNSIIKQKGGRGPLAEAHGPGESTVTDDVAMRLCTMVADDFKRECWRRASAFWGALQVSPSEMLRMCAKDSRGDADQCGAGVGDWVVRISYEGRKLDEVPQFIAEQCANDKQIEGWCLYGAVYPITGNAIWSNAEPDTWMNLCVLATSAEAKKTCMRGELRAIRALPDVERRMELGLARGYTNAELTSTEP
jgi:hypothetical protein